MAFAVRTNVAFNGEKNDDLPVQGCAVTFGTRDFLQIKVYLNFLLFNKY